MDKKEYYRQYRKKHLEERRAYDRVWGKAKRKKDPEGVRNKDIEYYYNNRRRKIDNAKRSRNNNIERVIRYNMNQRNKSKGFGDVPFSLDEFKIWYNQKDKECAYCGITEHLVSIGFWDNHRSVERLTVDRKDSQKGYELDNMCFACDTCNILKNNFFTHDEFREIAQKYIKPRWEGMVFPNTP